MPAWRQVEPGFCGQRRRNAARSHRVSASEASGDLDGRRPASTEETRFVAGRERKPPRRAVGENEECRNCGGLGHYAYHCKARGGQRQRRVQQSQQQQQQQQQHRQHEEAKEPLQKQQQQRPEKKEYFDEMPTSEGLLESFVDLQVATGAARCADLERQKAALVVTALQTMLCFASEENAAFVALAEEFEAVTKQSVTQYCTVCGERTPGALNFTHFWQQHVQRPRVVAAQDMLQAQRSEYEESHRRHGAFLESLREERKQRDKLMRDAEAAGKGLAARWKTGLQAAEKKAAERAKEEARRAEAKTRQELRTGEEQQRRELGREQTADWEKLAKEMRGVLVEARRAEGVGSQPQPQQKSGTGHQPVVATPGKKAGGRAQRTPLTGKRRERSGGSGSGSGRLDPQERCQAKSQAAAAEGDDASCARQLFGSQAGNGEGLRQ